MSQMGLLPKWLIILELHFKHLLPLFTYRCLKEKPSLIAVKINLLTPLKVEGGGKGFKPPPLPRSPFLFMNLFESTKILKRHKLLVFHKFETAMTWHFLYNLSFSDLTII